MAIYIYLVLVAGALHQPGEAGEAVAQHAEEVGEVGKLPGAVVPGDEAAARLPRCWCRAVEGA